MCKIVPRIKQIALNEGVTIGAIERAIGASKGVISRAITNGTDIQSKWLQAIVENYPHYSAQWLLTGEGNMLKSQPSNEIDTSITQSDPVAGVNYIPQTAPLDAPIIDKHQITNIKENGSIPLVSEKAVGGFFNEDFSIAERDIIGYYIIPKFRHLGVDFLIEVIGDSMLPRFFPGDIIACSMISNPKFIQWNKCYLIATREQGLIIKRLMPSENSSCFKAVSDNKDYPPFDIPKEEICGLARIVGAIHVE